MVYTLWLTRDIQAPGEVECQALLHIYYPLLIHRLSKCTFYILYKGTLAESPNAYAKANLVFICCCAEPWWADSHKLAVKGKVFVFDAGSLIFCDPSQASSLQLHCFIMT